jgi:hypothetical protein
MIRYAKKLSLPRMILAGLCHTGALSLAMLAAAAQTGAPQPALAPLAGLPLYFEANRGQVDGSAQFVARGRACNLFITPAEVIVALAKVNAPAVASREDFADAARARTVKTRSVRLRFEGASTDARAQGASELPGKANYFIGSDPARWHTGVSLFTKVRVDEIYPGVGLTYYGSEHRLEYDFVVAPRANPDAISIRVEGADAVRIDSRGDLVLGLGQDEIRQPKPVLYQIVGGVRKEVEGGYRLKDKQTVAFRVGSYDRDQPLVIDPVLSYSTFLGGSGSDTAWDVAVDTNGFVYVAGETMSAHLATPGAFQTNYAGGPSFGGGDAFVAKFDINKISGAGSNLVYLTYLGGSAQDAALAIAVDGAGCAYVTGVTGSTNFPTKLAITNAISGVANASFGIYPFDAFVAKLNADGSDLVFSTYLGGSAQDQGIGIAVDPGNNVYVTGFTASTNFPVTANAYTNKLAGVQNVFVTKIDSSGTNFVYSTYLGGTNTDHGEGIAADAAGRAYVTGYTDSTNFPTTTNALRTLLNGSTNLIFGFDAFVAQFPPTNGAPVYSTLLGGTNNDISFRITVDTAGGVYVTGSSQSPDFPNTTTNVAGLRTGINTNGLLFKNAFLTKFNFTTNGAALAWSALFGGSGIDEGWQVAVDPAGNAFVVGATTSTNFPAAGTSGFLRATNSGGSDAFVTAFNPNATALLYSACLGGSGDDFGYGIAVDPAGNAYVVGKTASTNFPTVAPFQGASGGTNDAFVAKILREPTLTAALSDGNVALAWRAFAPEFVLESNTNAASPGGWILAQPAPLPTNGWHTVTLDATNGALFFRLRKP